MNLSSDDSPFVSVPAAPFHRVPLEYVPLEYGDARALLPEKSPAEVPATNSETVAADPDPAVIQETPAETGPTAAELFEARLEEERRTIAAQAQQDAERKLQRVRAELAIALEQFARQRDEYFLQVEGEVVQLALSIARRVIHRETQIDPKLLAGLVNYELQQIDQSTSVHLIVSPDALSHWKETVTSLARPVELLTEKSLGADEVRIETALGSANISFERELQEIERGFADLLSRRPASAVQPARVQ